jgi:putative ABC transport system permease protein
MSREARVSAVLGAVSTFDSVSHDFRCAWRALATQARFAALVTITLALTIGAGTAVFSIANAVLLRPLPFADSERLVWLKTVRDESPLEQRASFPDFRDWRAQTQTLDLVGHGGLETVLTGAGEPERLRAEMFVGDLFSLLGVGAELGTAVRDDSAGPTAVLSHALWQRAFGADPDIVGNAITLDGSRYTVAAVMPAGFDYPIRAATRVDAWLPLERFNPALAERRNARLIDVLGRLRPGASLAEAQADLDVIAAKLSAEYPDTNRGLRVRLVPARDEATDGAARGLVLLCAAVSALVLVGGINVASLLLARTIARGKELATRAALGATRSRIARQLVIESMLLAGIGGGIGTLLAYWGVGAAASWLPATIPRVGELAAGADVIGIGLALSLASGSLFGLVPGLGAVRAASSSALKEGGASRGPRAKRAFSGLLLAEMTLATVLLAGSGLFTHSFLKLDRADAAYDPRNVLTFELSWPAAAYRDPADAFGRLRARLLEIPGVLSASTGLQLPYRGEALLDDTAPFAQIEGRPLAADERARVASLTVQPGFMRTLGIPLVGGRDFSDDDRAGTPRVALVNRSFAQAYLGDEDPLGRRLRLDSWTLPGDSAAEIVGVVADVRHEGSSTAEPMVYLPFAQWPKWTSPLVVKTRGEPLAFVPAVREAVRAIDAAQPIDSIATLEQRLAGSLAQDRFRAELLAAFSGIALLLAAVGLFAVLSYTAAQRVREIGVRMAFGARAEDVARVVVRDGMLPVVGGIVLGVTGAALLFRLVDNLLFEVATTDAGALAAAIGVLLIVASLACAVPARRAARTDPAAALRGE